MITATNEKVHEYDCLSTDVTVNADGTITPNEDLGVVGNGSMILLMDTLKIYMYDEENEKWQPMN